MSCPTTALVPRRRGLAAPALVALIVLIAPAAQAAAPGSLAGHWKGALKAGGRALELDVDFAPKGNGWAGDISIPAQGAKDLPLQGITLEGDQVSFKLADAPG